MKRLVPKVLIAAFSLLSSTACDPDIDESPPEKTERGERAATKADGQAAPSQWDCSVDYYDAHDGCDCGCGIIDPDCHSASVVACEYEWCKNEDPLPDENWRCAGSDTTPPVTANCTRDAQCSEGLVCRPNAIASLAKSCLPLAAGGEACDANTDCLDDATTDCSHEADVGGRICVYGVSRPCNTDLGCIDDNVCRPHLPSSATPQCLPRGEPGDGCHDEADCLDDLHCLDSADNGGYACVQLG